MRHTAIKTLTSFLVISLMNIACSKKEQIGPSVNGLFGSVSITTPLEKSAGAPDFSQNQTVYFTAGMSNTTNWTLTIIGETTGAKKTITGTSSDLNASNAVWDGSADDLPSFQIENVKAYLTFQNASDTSQTALSVAGKRDADAGGILITNFVALNGGWTHDWQPITNLNANYAKPDGNSYLYMSGTPWQGSPITPYVNFLKITPNTADTDYGTYFPLPADGNKVYFNVMVYATETADTWLQIMVSEAQGVARAINIRPNWTGWKLVSVRYSDMLVGDGDKDKPLTPDKITFVQFTLLTDAVDLAAKQTVTTAYDHPIFTLNKPYQP